MLACIANYLDQAAKTQPFQEDKIGRKYETKQQYFEPSHFRGKDKLESKLMNMKTSK